MFKKSKEHLAETGMNWWEHWCHVWYMMWCCFMALITGIPHAFVPGIFPGAGRKWQFDKALMSQLHTRPNLLKEIQEEFDEKARISGTNGAHSRSS